MAFDYKKEYKEFYMPKNKPGIVEVPPMNYLAVAAKEIRMQRAVSIRNPSDYFMRLHLPSK